MKLSITTSKYFEAKTLDDVNAEVKKAGVENLSVTFLSKSWKAATDKQGKSYLGSMMILRQSGEAKEGQGHLVHWNENPAEARLYVRLYKEDGHARVFFFTNNNQGRCEFGDLEGFVVDGRLVRPQYGTTEYKALIAKGATVCKSYAASTNPRNLWLINAIIGLNIAKSFPDLVSAEEFSAPAPSKGTTTVAKREVPASSVTEVSSDELVGVAHDQNAEIPL
jgi:hypothetical protein